MSNHLVSAALALHHNEPSPYVQLRLPVNPLIDETHCNEISRALQTFGKDWEVTKATPTLWKSLPAKCGLYMFVWCPPLTFRLARDPARLVSAPYILYIGQAGGGASRNTLKSRYKGEYANYVGADPAQLWETDTGPDARASRLRRYLTLAPLEYWWCAIDDKDQIKRLESRLNFLLSPPLNRAGRARLIEVDAFPPPTKRS